MLWLLAMATEIRPVFRILWGRVRGGWEGERRGCLATLQSKQIKTERAERVAKISQERPRASQQCKRQQQQQSSGSWGAHTALPCCHPCSLMVPGGCCCCISPSLLSPATARHFQKCQGFKEATVCLLLNPLTLLLLSQAAVL